MNKYIALIPAYKPTIHLVDLLKELSKNGFINIVVDDGSGIEYNHIFSKASNYAEVLQNSKNLGKGLALKKGLTHIVDSYPKRSIVVTVDADGQHKPNDAMTICKIAEKHTDALVLGSRKMTNNVPLRSKIGNTITRFVYRLSTGLKVYDTQTGLRAFSVDLIPELLKIPGDRYEYEMNMLLQFAKKQIPIIEHEIETVYINKNVSSHFNTLTDSFKIYKEILKFSASSFVGFLIDYGVYTLLLFMGLELTLSNVIARVISASVNFTLNRKLVFHSNEHLLKTAVKYACLAICILVGNTILLNFLVKTCNINKLIAKILTETTFYIFSWLIQRLVIFRRGDDR